jgi:cell division transport system ATP-binding protein
VITLANVSKGFEGKEILRDISCTITPNEFVCITGASGAGKSTLIDMLIGAQLPDSGTITVDNIPLEKIPTKALQLYRQRIGVVFQDYKLLWNLTVEENIAYPLEVLGLPQAQINLRVSELLELMHLNNQRTTLARSLSGGEKARTAIARAIAHNPLIIFADEPTGNLDPHESVHVMKILKTIHSTGTTVIVATHDFFLVDALQTRVLRLENGAIVRDSVGSYEGTTATTTKKENATTGKSGSVKVTASK